LFFVRHGSCSTTWRYVCNNATPQMIAFNPTSVGMTARRMLVEDLRRNHSEVRSVGVWRA
jgi:hypothetical protein